MKSVIVIMGVSGSGKTTIGTLLAERTGLPFFDGDKFHPAENIEKMRNQIPLNDEDRKPWLKRLRDLIDSARAAGNGCIVACSGLKERYRDVLLLGVDDAHLVFLNPSAEDLEQRVRSRKHEYMPASLLPSQLSALEPPRSSIEITSGVTPEQAVSLIIEKVASRAAV